jgi:hypothetical protein
LQSERFAELGEFIPITKKEFLMRSFTLDEVIGSMLKANVNPSPAYKAHATRRLKAYTLQRCAETNAKPSRIIAGVRAAVSKRKPKS